MNTEEKVYENINNVARVREKNKEKLIVIFCHEYEFRKIGKWIELYFEEEFRYE
jgi:hypothetical protein